MANEEKPLEKPVKYKMQNTTVLTILVLASRLAAGNKIIAGYMNLNIDLEEMLTIMIIPFTEIQIADGSLRNGDESFITSQVINVRFADFGLEYEEVIWNKMLHFDIGAKISKDFQKFNENKFIENTANFYNSVMVDFVTNLRIVINQAAFPLQSFDFLLPTTAHFSTVFVKSLEKDLEISIKRIVNRYPRPIFFDEMSTKLEQKDVARRTQSSSYNLKWVNDYYINSRDSSIDFLGPKGIQKKVLNDIKNPGLLYNRYLLYDEKHVLAEFESNDDQREDFRRQPEIYIFVNGYFDSMVEINLRKKEVSMSPNILCQIDRSFFTETKERGVFRLELFSSNAGRII